MQGAEPAAGVLYLVGTPIGNIGDLSPRARHVLAHVDRIACEDTRRSGLLLHNLGLRSREQGPRLLSFHEHNQAARIPELLQALAAGGGITLRGSQNRLRLHRAGPDGASGFWRNRRIMQ